MKSFHKAIIKSGEVLKDLLGIVNFYLLLASGWGLFFLAQVLPAIMAEQGHAPAQMQTEAERMKEAELLPIQSFLQQNPLYVKVLAEQLRSCRIVKAIYGEHQVAEADSREGATSDDDGAA